MPGMAAAKQPGTAWKVLAVFCGTSEDTGCGEVQEFADLPRAEAEVVALESLRTRRHFTGMLPRPVGIP